MMDHYSSRLKHKPPACTGRPKTPFVIFGVHVETLIEAANLIDDRALHEERGCRQHSNVATMRVIPEFSQEQLASCSSRDEVKETQASNEYVPRCGRIAPRTDLERPVGVDEPRTERAYAKGGASCVACVIVCAC